MKKKTLSILLFAILISCLFSFSSCSDDKDVTDEFKGYKDVSIVVAKMDIGENNACDLSDEIVELFFSETNSISIQHVNDGKRYSYCLVAIRINDHPLYADKWFTEWNHIFSEIGIHYNYKTIRDPESGNIIVGYDSVVALGGKYNMFVPGYSVYLDVQLVQE